MRKAIFTVALVLLAVGLGDLNFRDSDTWLSTILDILSVWIGLACLLTSLLMGCPKLPEQELPYA